MLPVCEKVLPFTFKKESELQTTIDCLEDGITGDEAVRGLNVSIESGRREGLVRKTSIPFKVRRDQYGSLERRKAQQCESG